MLVSLTIRDLAIIDTLELELSAGLTVLTGETGAGKSIVVDALQLLAGGRAGAEVVRHGAARAEVSGTFDVGQAPPGLAAWLAGQSLAPEGGELIIRRVVGSDGRTRSFLNGQAVPLALLREAGELLIDIHGQHEFQSLTRAVAQRELLDAYGTRRAGMRRSGREQEDSHEALLVQVGESYRAWRALEEKIGSLEAAARDRDARLELLSYQVQELTALKLKPGEVAALTEERTRLSHRGKLAEGAQQALSALSEAEDVSAHAQVSRAASALKPLAALDPQLAAVIPLLEEASIQIREAAGQLSRYGESLEMDPARQDEVERRLFAIEELSRKNRVPPADLITRAEQASAELEALKRADTDLAELKAERAAALERYQAKARQLSVSRVAAAAAMGEEITARMQTLGMAGGRFEVQVTSGGEPREQGLDQVELRVSANPGQPPRPLAKVASGGELARLSLAVQVAVSAHETRCMVFDEVDSGIGGAVAEIVGRELRQLGSRGQVLCVTHLPQVAAQGRQHLRVVKLTDGETTRTQLTQLAPAERVEEVARMLGGLTLTSRTREHAREMLTGAEAGDMSGGEPGRGAPAAGKEPAETGRPRAKAGPAKAGTAKA